MRLIEAAAPEFLVMQGYRQNEIDGFRVPIPQKSVQQQSAKGPCQLCLAGIFESLNHHHRLRVIGDGRPRHPKFMRLHHTVAAKGVVGLRLIEHHPTMLAKRFGNGRYCIQAALATEFRQPSLRIEQHIPLLGNCGLAYGISRRGLEKVAAH